MHRRKGAEMNAIKKIMAAIDLSDYTCSILETAESLAKALQCELLIANIINPGNVDAIKLVEQFEHDFKDIPHDVKVGKYLEKQKEERSKQLDAMVERLGLSHISARKIYKVGIPFEQLIWIVKDEDVDLVVMGPKGKTNLATVLFGTTAEKMFRHCPVSVLSVREKASDDLRACMFLESKRNR
jgi:nucleotide-binding universal stress UspA family protein